LALPFYDLQKEYRMLFDAAGEPMQAKPITGIRLNGMPQGRVL